MVDPIVIVTILVCLFRLTGTLPPDTASSSQFEILDLSYNRISGSWQERDVHVHEKLHLHVNRLSGMLPPDLDASRGRRERG